MAASVRSRIPRKTPPTLVIPDTPDTADDRLRFLHRSRRNARPTLGRQLMSNNTPQSSIATSAVPASNAQDAPQQELD